MDRLAYTVYEAGGKVGYITRRSAWFEFVASRNYSATGLAAEMAEACGDTAEGLAHTLRAAGLEVRVEDVSTVAWGQ